MRLRGYFRKGPLEAGYVIALVSLPKFEVRQNIEFLIDTGATRTTILDKDAITLGIEHVKLPKLEQPLLGLGGLVETYFVRDAVLYFKTEINSEHMEILSELLVVKHKRVDENIIRIPSVLGRDILSKYRLIYDKPHDMVVITDESRDGRLSESCS